MRLACENCTAVYLIDDAAITARGVRAQCPRCKNIQFIPPGVEPGVDPATRAREMANPISVSRPPVPGREPEPGKSQVARMALNTRMVARPPAPPPEALTREGPEARGELFGELDWSDGDPIDPGGALVPASAVPVSGAAAAVPPPSAAEPTARPQLGVPPVRPPPVAVPAGLAPPAGAGNPFTLDDLFGPGEDTPPAAATPAPGTCASCGEALETLEDVASGVCFACRKAAEARLAPAPVAVPPRPPLPELAPPPRNTQLPRRTSPAPRVAARPPSPSRRGRLVLAALAVVVGVGVGALRWLRARGGGAPVPAAQRTPKPRVDPQAPLPSGLAERIEGWRAAAPGPRPTAEEALREAQREIALDQPAAYGSAERRLQAALVDAPRNADLLGTWLSAVSLGRGAALAPGEYPTLVELGESAAVRSGHAPAVLLGLAELLLARPGPGVDERARALAQEALTSDGPYAVRARLVLARTYVRTSGGLALAELQAAELLDPSQRLIPLVRAEAEAVNGDPRAALAALQSRLALEPDHAASLFATGSLLVEVGEPDQARRLFERLQGDPRTQDGPALLALAALDANVQSRPRDAMTLLRAALKRDRLAPRARVQASVLLASAARAAADTDTANTAARTALALDPVNPGAHLVLLLLALDRGDGAAAAEELPAVAGHLGDPALEGLLEGRVRIAQGESADAAGVFERVARADPRRTDALLWAAASLASVPNRAQALALGAEVVQADPTRTGPWIPLAPVALRPEDLLRGSEGRLARLSQADGDSQPLLDEAVLRFHRRDLAGAEAALARVLKVDGAAPVALAWRALVLLERGDAKGAQLAAAQAQQSSRAIALVQYAAGASALALGDLDGARRLLREAVQLAPALLAAQVKLAEVEVRLGAIGPARERLRKVVQIDPSYASAKRALYLLPKENE